MGTLQVVVGMAPGVEACRKFTSGLIFLKEFHITEVFLNHILLLFSAPNSIKLIAELLQLPFEASHFLSP